MITRLLAQATTTTTVLPNPSFPNQTGIGGVIPRILPSCANDPEGCTRLEDLMTLFTNISQVVLAGTGMVLLGVMVYGGFLYLTSAGDTTKVKKATQMLYSCIFGLVIVFGAYTVISYGVSRLVGIPTAPTPSYVTICTTNNDGAPCGPSSVCNNEVCTPINASQ